MSLKERIHDVSDRFTKAQILDSLGLQEKHPTTDYVLPALGIFGAGIAVGALLGVLFAPKPGPELRSDIRRRIDDLRHAEEEENPYTG
ncbi:MAG: hypothetical protein CMH57_08115 [Myxococcales bacterium]|nr:hypothetical protein [Myxococcales bacterium]